MFAAMLTRIALTAAPAATSTRALQHEPRKRIAALGVEDGGRWRVKLQGPAGREPVRCRDAQELRHVVAREDGPAHVEHADPGSGDLVGPVIERSDEVATGAQH